MIALLLSAAVWTPSVFALPTTAPVGPRIVLIIRHAEKPEETIEKKDPDLSRAGFARADALASVIANHFPKPDFLIATKRSRGSNRPVETITPLSKALNVEIESNFRDDEYAVAAKEILTNPKYAGKTVLVAWHHGKIPAMAAALGVTGAPDTWDPKVFDRVWEITFNNGKTNFKDLPQNAMPGDAEK